MQELISGTLGPEAAASFYGYLNNRTYTLPSAAKILSEYDSVRPEVLRLVSGGRFDLMGLVLKKLVSLMDGCETQCKNLNKLINDLPEEFQLMFFKLLAVEKPEIFLPVAERMDAFNALADQVVSLLM